MLAQFSTTGHEYHTELMQLHIQQLYNNNIINTMSCYVIKWRDGQGGTDANWGRGNRRRKQYSPHPINFRMFILSSLLLLGFFSATAFMLVWNYVDNGKIMLLLCLYVNNNGVMLIYVEKV